MSRAEWCRRYAQINSVGLRKILKKHDKMCKNRAGQTYMQVRALLVDIAAPSHHSASFHALLKTGGSICLSPWRGYAVLMALSRS